VAKKRGRRKKRDMIWRLNGLGALLICCSWQTDREGEKIAHLLFWWPDERGKKKEEARNDLEIERLGSFAHLLFLAETGGDRLLEGETGFVGQRPDLLFLGAL
jgi:hypothetical protein